MKIQLKLHDYIMLNINDLTIFCWEFLFEKHPKQINDNIYYKLIDLSRSFSNLIVKEYDFIFSNINCKIQEKKELKSYLHFLKTSILKIDK